MATANNQQTINPKRWKNAFSVTPTRVHHRLPGLTLYQCRHLVAAQKARTSSRGQSERLARLTAVRTALPLSARR